MTLRPVYAKNNPDKRICYKANGLWKLQERGEAKGTKTHDCWHDMSPAMSLDEAMIVLKRHGKDKVA